jgi:hypothetical protein
MSRKNPNPSPLNALTEKQQQQIISWLDIHPPSEVIVMVRRDPPEGFGIVTYDTSLRRFYARHKLAARKDNVHLAAEFTAEPLQDQPFDDLTTSATRQLAFEIATGPGIGLKHFNTLSRWVLKHRELLQRDRALAIQSERLAFDRERYEFDTARTVLLHHIELETIRKDDASSDEEKIDQARSLIFNRPISELPPRIVPER